MVLSCDGLTDDKLIAKSRSCFSYAPTMNEAREELRSMRQLEHESVSVYIYKWGRALYRSSGIHPENERHPHVIKDFISSLKKNRNKITSKWAEMRQPPSTVEKAFKLACDAEKQLQVADSFKLEFSSYPTVEVNEISAEESSGDELKVSEVSRGKRWEIIIVTTKSVLILVTAATMATDPNRTNLRTIDKVSSGDKNQKTPSALGPAQLLWYPRNQHLENHQDKRLQNHFDPGVSSLCAH